MNHTAHTPQPSALPAGLQRRGEHLLAELAGQRQSEIAATATSGGRRWRPRALAVTAMTAAALVSGTGAVVALSPAVTRSADGTTGVDLRLVQGVYRGQAVDLATVEQLNADGRARVSVASHELGCQNVMLYFDTETQADDYGRGYLQRLEARKSKPQDVTGDPCADVADAPDFRPAR